MVNEPFCTITEPFRIHSGRAAERTLFAAIGGSGRTAPDNTHVGTTGVSCIKRHAVASAWLSGGSMAAWYSGAQRRLTDA
jgi:hypothetical protein